MVRFYIFVDNKVIIEIESPKFDSNIPCIFISSSIDTSYQKVSYYGNERKESYNRDRKGGNVLPRVAFNMQNNPHGILTLKHLLGHASQASTEIYIDISMVDTTNKLHPSDICDLLWAEYKARHVDTSTL